MESIIHISCREVVVNVMSALRDEITRYSVIRLR